MGKVKLNLAQATDIDLIRICKQRLNCDGCPIMTPTGCYKKLKQENRELVDESRRKAGVNMREVLMHSDFHQGVTIEVDGLPPTRGPILTEEEATDNE